ncbi:MAG: hypothetical protein EOO17_02545 [Chloroflexi bacterium]|nr:MAG: hypothetical protein EOO17_02545 [Chloroflexota bacterium]
MITITDRVKTWVTEHPFHATFMADGLINASALARLIQPDIANQMGEAVTVEAITLALNRYGKDSHSATLVDFDRYIGEVSVQSGLSIMTIPQVDLNSDEFFRAIMELQKQQEYTIYTRGIWHTALIGKKEVISTLSQSFPGTITSHDIVGITVKLKPGHLPVPGVCAYVLQKLAHRNINLQEVTSSHNELTVFIHRIDTNKALECLV